MEKSIERLQYLCNTIPHLLNEIDETVFSDKTDRGTWSKKEIMGHLIDSATNNHQRFVRGQFEKNPTIMYDPDKWNAGNYYGQMDKSHIIKFWTTYNKHILELIKRIPKEKLNNKVNTGENEYTLTFLFIDYVSHLEHHLHQVVVY